ncbi:NADH:flavin oxidoreductase/NADH oxidase [Ephemerocybe angulata]|uniref:NADH:flavin oxidoreductase/NADH oxidase n=1 Tax=Ephemerocybe angulata TaxID=980116 RepID=A0A8H6I975_9AGAR|nr:NADH:flavin oxidoreductase/NADH oxidase [Tulosesus angulatus]
MSSPATSTPKLFSPIKIGGIQLQHRVVLAPQTRLKATRTGHVPTLPLMKEYYAQRASVPGTLLITEGTVVAPAAGGYAYAPGIWNAEQIDAWKEITQAVHAKGSYIFLQIAALGRGADPATLKEDGNFDFVSASNIPLTTPVNEPPRALTLSEINEYVGWFAQAGKNAIEAGFDGIEVHGAYGYLVDQFLQDTSNKRTDGYGGSVENRSRFALRIMDAISEAIGAERTAIRLSPWNRYQDMKMDDPKPQFSHFVTSLVDKHPDLAYIHVVEPPQVEGKVLPGESNEFLREIWAPRPYITNGDYTRETALKSAEREVLVAFGKDFLATPDLPYRLQHNIPANQPNPATFYVKLDEPNTEKGYTDYPFSEQFLNRSQRDEISLA